MVNNIDDVEEIREKKIIKLSDILITEELINDFLRSVSKAQKELHHETRFAT